MGFQAQTQVAIPGGGDSTAGMMHALSGLQKSVLLNRKRQDDIKQAAVDNALTAKKMEAEAAYRNQLAADSAARLKIAESVESRAAAEATRLANERKAIQDAKVAAATGAYSVKDRTDGVVLDTPEKQKAYITETGKMVKEANDTTGMNYDPYNTTMDNTDAKEWNDLEAKIQEQLKTPLTQDELDAKYKNEYTNIDSRYANNEITRAERDKLRNDLVTAKENDRIALFGEPEGGISNAIGRAAIALSGPFGLKDVMIDAQNSKEEPSRLARKTTSDRLSEREKLVAELRSKQDELTKRIESRTTTAWDDRNSRLKEKTDSITKERKDGISRYKTSEEIQDGITKRVNQYIKDHPKASKAEIIAAHEAITSQAKPYLDNIAKVQAAQAELKMFDAKEASKQKHQSKRDMLAEVYEATYNPKTQTPEKSSFTPANAQKMEEIISKKDSDGDPYYSPKAIKRAKKWLEAYDDEVNL